MTTEVLTNYGTMFVPEGEEWLRISGASLDNEYIELVCGLLAAKPPGAIVDVGAGIGCWSLALAKYATKVVAIEPEHFSYALMRGSIAANGITNIELTHAAAGAEDATKDGGVAVIKLDSWVVGENVTFIRIKADGKEADVITGAWKTLLRCKPILFVEMDHPDTDSRALNASVEWIGYVTEQHGGNFLGMPV